MARCFRAPAVFRDPCRNLAHYHDLEEETAIAATKEVRVNDRIRIPVVRVIGPDGEQVGILGIREALAYAQERQLDLVEVSPTAHPPVCRVMDFGKYKYEQSKKAQKARRKQHVMHLKEVKLRPKIEGHDFNFKIAHGREFLEAHDKVKFTVTFRGRELAHSEVGYRLLERVVRELDEVGQVEIPPRMEGRSLVLLMIPRTSPRPHLGRAASPAPAAARSAAPKG
jgi:translation initiation factor IF-3